VLEERRRIGRLSREGGWLIIGQVIGVLGQLMLIRVMTEYLAPAEYGTLALALTIGVLVCQVSFANSMPGIMRYYTLAVECGDVLAFARAAQRSMGLSAIIAIALTCFILLGAMISQYSAWLPFIVAASLISILGSFNSTLSGIQNAARQRAVVAAHGAIDPWLRIILAASAVKYLGPTVFAALVGYSIAAALVMCSQWIFFLRLLTVQSQNVPNAITSWDQKIWTFSKPYVFFNLPTWAQTNSDRWSLQTYANSVSVGQFSALMQLGYAPIFMIVGFVNTLIGPILYSRSGDATDELRNAGVHRISWVLVAICLLLTGLGVWITWVFNARIFALLVGAEFQSVSYLLPWTVLAGGMLAAGQILNVKMASELRTQALLWPKMVISVAGVGVNFIGAYYGGIDGVVIAANVSSFVALIWFAFLAMSTERAAISI